MKSKLFFMIIIIILASTNFVLAKENSDSTSDIGIDGSFDDWRDKPFLSDEKHDADNEETQNWNDFLGAGYFADDEYLYLHVIRQAAKKSEAWKFYLIVDNAAWGTLESHNPPNGEIFEAPQFEIISSYEGRKSHSGALVEVWFEGEQLEVTTSADNNNKEIEFRIPLEKVGLDGFSKEISFRLKSEQDDKTNNEDWMPGGGSIIVTSGPTFYQLSSILFFIAVAFLVYKRAALVKK